MSFKLLPEEQRICHCFRCLQPDSSGTPVSAKTFRLHKKRPAELMDEPFLDLENVAQPPDSAPPSLGSHIVQPPDSVPFSSASSSLQLPTPITPDPSFSFLTSTTTRLEVQQIRYETMSLSHRLLRPRYLDFMPCVQSRISRQYTYQGLFNQAPYSLVIHSPANAPLLRLESTLHTFAERLLALQSLPHVKCDANLQLSVRSSRKEVLGRLNELFAWKVEIHESLRLAGQTSASLPVVDTSERVQSCSERPELTL